MLAGLQSDQPVTLLTDQQLDAWLLRGEEDIEAIAALWQRYAAKRYKNIIVAEEGEVSAESA